MHLALGLVAPAALLIFNMAQAAPLTIDDSYISFRYARNLAHGLGLVYNAGERVEGYTNFLWTVLLAAGIRVGLDPEHLAKWLGGAAALGALAVTWRLSEKLLPFRRVPTAATWLLGSSMVFAGYAVLGLETSLFTFLILLGTLLFLGERDAPERWPVSALPYALAGLTRPEAPLYLGLAMLLLGRRAFVRQNLQRAAIFAAVVGAHLAWRHAYYGAWLPNTFDAKTGMLAEQLARGGGYVGAWLERTGAIFWFSLFGAALVVARRDWLGGVVLATALAVLAYVVVVGGDWMPCFRFLAPFEPFGFLLVDLGLRSAAETRSRAALAALGIFTAGSGVQRVRLAQSQRAELMQTKADWQVAAGGLADWLLQHPRGTVALADIGYVGWATDYPILDVLGLVDPTIARLPGGYVTKQGPEYIEYVFRARPEYFVLISAQGDCDHPFHPAHVAVYAAPGGRFQELYQVAHRIPLGNGGLGWCIEQLREASP